MAIHWQCTPHQQEDGQALDFGTGVLLVKHVGPAHIKTGSRANRASQACVLRLSTTSVLKLSTHCHSNVT